VSLILHLDGNTFYASVHRVFRPELRRRPVVVLSNNDGCVVTRTKEAKALGIARGTPFFKIRDLAAAHRVAVFSSNYELYQSMSNRMMAAVRSLLPTQEIYSIDEQFSDITGMPGDMTELGRAVRERVRRWTGIPVCVGIAPTKTLAKFCDHLAKTDERFGGVANWLDMSREEHRARLASQSAGEIWGVGSRLASALLELGVESAWDFVCMPAAQVRRTGGVVLERTWCELRGVSVIPFESTPPARQQILRSRTFGKAVPDFGSVLAAVTEHMDSAARTLRSLGLEAGRVGVFFHTDPFREELPQYAASPSEALEHPSSDTIALTEKAAELAARAFRPGFLYRKAGVVLSDLRPAGSDAAVQPSLFDDGGEAERKRRRALMASLDALEARWGKGTVRCASAKLGNGDWKMRRDRMTPCYTTRWDDLLQVG
jgi:DNA polymerase V